MLSHFSWVGLWDPIDCNPPGSSVHGILQARILEWVVMPCSRVSSGHRDRTNVCCIAGGFFTTEPPRKPKRMLEHAASSYSRGSSWLRDWTSISNISCIGRQILYHCTTWEAPYHRYVLLIIYNWWKININNSSHLPSLPPPNFYYLYEYSYFL